MRLLREPLFHFAILGAALFVWFNQINPPSPEVAAPDQILVDTQDVERLGLRFEATRQRPPTPEETTQLVDAAIRQEIMVREARALGLDIGDEVIRNRLVQKMVFLLESGATSQAPDDAVLEAYLGENPEKFVQPGWIAFEQVYLGQAPDPETVAKIRQQLDAGVDPLQLGERSQLPAYVPPSRSTQVDGVLGRGVFAKIEPLPSDEWAGPIQSGFGAHFVRITDREAASTPPLAKIRDKVLAEWMREAADALSAQRYEALQSKYEIIRPELAGASE